jgi:hypothetical protein
MASAPSAASMLLGKVLDGGWTVKSMVVPLNGSTGGHFSVGYLVEHADGRQAASATEQGAPVAPMKTSSKKPAIAKKVAPPAQKPAKGAKPKSPVAKARPGSKSAKVLELLARPNGASLAELMKATRWQAHSIHGFLSTVSRKRGVKIESLKNGKGERVYRVKK